MNLGSYKNIQSNLFISINIPGYGALNFSDYHKAYTLNGTNYTALGQLLSVSATRSNLKTTNEEVAIVISGIPTNRISDILATKFKGSSVSILRAFFDPVTAQLLSITGNPLGKFQGIVSNYDITDGLSMGTQQGNIILTITAVSFIDQLNTKLAGRKTSPSDELKFYPGDHSMDRVVTVANSNFNFGAV